MTRGLRRREAETRCTELVIIDADDAADARAFETVVRAVEALVPQLVLDRPGRCSFPTRGPSRYFGGDDALAQRVLATVREAGVADARVGIADGDLAAGLAARAADTLVVPQGGSAAFLAPWSVGVLAPHVDGGAELADLLARLGLRTLGTFAELPEPSVLGRFGLPGVQAHRLAHGDSTSGSVPTPLPLELVETIEFDPPAERVDEAAFAAKSLADRLLGRLDELGLSCTRVIVEAETEHGERLARCWRHDGSLTPATLVTRVRWQLEGWLTATVGITLLRLVPDEVVPATGRQLGFWGGDPAAADHAARALARVQGMLGPESVVIAVPTGGRSPTERVCWVPWGEEREVDTADAPWPGMVPGPAPARVFDPPLAADLVDADGSAVTVNGRGEPSAEPAHVRCAALANGGGPLIAWAGPWPHDLRWWDRTRGKRRGAWWQVVVDGGEDTAVACLVVVSRGRAEIEAIYDWRSRCQNLGCMTAFVFNVTFDCADPRTLSAFWSEVTGYEATEVRDDFARLSAPDHRGVRHLLFFKVPEPKTVKNRMHVDLATRDVESEIARLLTLGATEIDRREGNGTQWVVMNDPEGNEFCIG